MRMKDRTCDEHQATCGSVELLYCTPETNITLYVNWNINKNFIIPLNNYYFLVL